MKNTYNKLTCLFGHHNYGKKLTRDKYDIEIHLCKICKRNGYRKFSSGNDVWRDYNEEGNLTHVKWGSGTEHWYNGKDNIIHTKRSDGEECWLDYSEEGNRVHKRWNSGNEVWYEYNEKGYMIHEKWSYGEEVWYNNDGYWVDEKPKNWKYDEKQIQ